MLISSMVKEQIELLFPAEGSNIPSIGKKDNDQK